MRYVPALDGIRAVAVAMVLAFHARTPGFEGGFLGVDVFFVLSGYLITRLLAGEQERTGTIAIGRFYLRRLRRLYPALLLMVGVYLLIADRVFQGKTEHGRDAAVAALYLADYGRAFWRVPEVLQHTWSLSIEEHFYLVWPAILIGVLKLPTRQRIVVLLALFVVATLWRWGVIAWVDEWRQPYYRFDTRLSGLFLGAALGLWRPRTSALHGLAGIAMVAAAVFLSAWREPQSLMAWALLAEIGTGLIVLSVERMPVLGSSSLAWLGRMSYGIYLWHYPAMYWMREHYFGWPETLIMGGGLSVAMAALSYYLVERRIHRSFAVDRARDLVGGAVVRSA